MFNLRLVFISVVILYTPDDKTGAGIYTRLAIIWVQELVFSGMVFSSWHWVLRKYPGTWQSTNEALLCKTLGV